MNDLKKERAERDAALCAYYREGHKASECAVKFKLGRQRVQQILQKAGAWTPYVKGDRTTFLGVSVTEDDKVMLRREAERRGLSMSALTSDLIREMLAAVQS